MLNHIGRTSHDLRDYLRGIAAGMGRPLTDEFLEGIALGIYFSLPWTDDQTVNDIVLTTDDLVGLVKEAYRG